MSWASSNPDRPTEAGTSEGERAYFLGQAQAQGDDADEERTSHVEAGESHEGDAHGEDAGDEGVREDEGGEG